MNKELDEFLKKELRKFLESSEWIWRVEEGKVEKHHYGTFTTSKYIPPYTDIHYCTDLSGMVFHGEGAGYYVYPENGDGESFSNLGDAEQKVWMAAWNKKKKKLTKEFLNRKKRESNE